MDSIPLPLIDLPEPEPSLEWARLPFALGPAIAPLTDAALRCRVETLTGAAIGSELVAFDTIRGELGLRTAPDTRVLSMPFARFRRLTLVVPVPLPRPTPGALLERDRDQAEPRDYRVELAGGGFIDGRSCGHARHGSGWFFFAPTDVAGQVLRQFVPAAAALRVSFGATDGERAREHWIAAPDELVAVLASRARTPPKPLGEALIELGLTRRGEIERALADQKGAERGQALGQMLLERGLIDQQDLQIALAHKMGVPLVDASRFPIDEGLVQRFPRALLRECRALPLLVHGPRLVVLLLDLARLARLVGDPALRGLQVQPALATRRAFVPVLQRQLGPSAADPWAHNVPLN